MARTYPYAGNAESVYNSNPSSRGSNCIIPLSGAITQFLLVVVLTIAVAGTSYAQERVVKADHQLENLSDKITTDGNTVVLKPVKREAITSWSRRQAGSNAKQPAANRTHQPGKSTENEISDQNRMRLLGGQIKNTQEQIDYAVAHPELYTKQDIQQLCDVIAAKQQALNQLRKPGN